MKNRNMLFKIMVPLITAATLLSACAENKDANNVSGPGDSTEASEAEEKEPSDKTEDKVQTPENSAANESEKAGGEGGSAAEDKEDKEDKETGSGAFVPLISHGFVEREDGRSILYYSKYDLISLGKAASDYPELNKKLNERNDEARKKAEGDADIMEDEARAFREESDNEQPFYTINKVYVRRADREIFSYMSTYEDYYGGAHGSNGSGGVNYYTATGEEVKLSDVIADMDLLREVLSDRLKARYPDTDWFEDLNTALLSYGEGKEYTFNWVLENQGVTFVFNPYELAPYAYGQQFITIPYNEVPGLFTGKINNNDGAYVSSFDLYQDISAFQSSGREMPIKVDAEYDYENGGYMGEYPIKSITVNCDGNTCTTDNDSSIAYSYDQDYYLIHNSDGNNYIYADIYQDNDWHSVLVFALGSDGKIRSLGETDGRINDSSAWNMDGGWYPSVFDPERFELTSRADLLSTVGTTRYYHVGPDGKPEPDTVYYTITSDLTIKSTIVLSAELLGETKDLTVNAPEVNERSGEIKKLPAGTGFLLWRTDNESYVDCVVKEDGKNNVYRLIVDYDENDGYRSIDGMNIENCFEELFWAG